VVRSGRVVGFYKQKVYEPMLEAGQLVLNSDGSLSYSEEQREELARFNRFITTATHHRNIRPRRAEHG